jgi:hypothetical protein
MQQNSQLLNRTYFSYSGKQVANLIMSLMGAIVDSIVISSEARTYMLSQGAPEADAVLVAESMEEMGEYGYTMEMNYFMAII